MELNKLQFFYDDAQDRLLMRIAAIDDGVDLELSAWLTRRFTGILWAAIHKALAVQVTLAHPQAAHASAEIIDMARQSAISMLTDKQAFGTQFDNDLPAHAGLTAGFLVRETRFQVEPGEPMRIDFRPADGHGIDVAFDEVELHGFCNLLQQAVESAHWDLPLILESAWEKKAGAQETRKPDADPTALPGGKRRLMN